MKEFTGLLSNISHQIFIFHHKGSDSHKIMDKICQCEGNKKFLFTFTALCSVEVDTSSILAHGNSNKFLKIDQKLMPNQFFLPNDKISLLSELDLERRMQFFPEFLGHMVTLFRLPAT